jgi:hypothetical protein
VPDIFVLVASSEMMQLRTRPRGVVEVEKTMVRCGVLRGSCLTFFFAKVVVGH